MDADIDEETFVLINLYNANTEMEQVRTICELLGDFCLDFNEKRILAGNFNLFFEPGLEASGGKPTSKKQKSISKFWQICEQNNLVDIWRIHNPILK